MVISYSHTIRAKSFILSIVSSMVGSAANADRAVSFLSVLAFSPIFVSLLFPLYLCVVFFLRFCVSVRSILKLNRYFDARNTIKGWIGEKLDPCRERVCCRMQSLLSMAWHNKIFGKRSYVRRQWPQIESKQAHPSKAERDFLSSLHILKVSFFGASLFLQAVLVSQMAYDILQASA